MKPPLFATTKNVNYLPNVLSIMDAEDRGAFASVWVDEQGFVAEGPMVNVAFVTPQRELVLPVFDNIPRRMHSQTHARARDQQQHHPLSPRGSQQQEDHRRRGKGCVEMAFVGSGLPVLPVVEWDGQPVGDGKVGPVMRALSDLLWEDMKSGPRQDPRGFTSFLPAMTETVAKSIGDTGTGKDVGTVHPWKVMAFLFLTSFSGLFCTLPLTKMMILDYKLMYPTGSAIAGIVNSFHTPKGAATAKLQLRALVKALVGSFIWDSFQWVYTGGDGCGFQDFPLFGLNAYKQRFYFDFSPSLVGVGMICPYIINFSLLLGAVVSSGIIWPLLKKKQGECYDDRRRMQSFESENLPIHFAVAGYVILAAISTAFVTRIFPQIRYHHVALCYALAPPLAFCNSLGRQSGWGGEIAGLAACGVVLVVIGNSAELMQDFRTAYLTLTSPRSMFASQVIGTTLGCLVNPFLFAGFQRIVGKDHLGEAGTLYAAPMAIAFRGIAALSVQGIKALPKHSIHLCALCFFFALCFDCITSVAKAKKWRVKAYIPNIMAMAVPFFIGPTFAIDMSIGSIILILWKKADKQAAAMLYVVVASGLICGDGLWALPSAFSFHF
ncbi:hypothetical protein PR202_ga24323 [Eleusine coracana subsp. coracana]|uniref:Uncharacterized protein n=1 Tax=Eleusine coracana subsp. coracana TaxID=191504 RepID=A0AAV5D971_ELECO|nr:hypothetical protein PR202_ga24323 [Eleusine coracana subsp. coracana]